MLVNLFKAEIVGGVLGFAEASFQDFKFMFFTEASTLNAEYIYMWRGGDALHCGC